MAIAVKTRLWLVALMINFRPFMSFRGHPWPALHGFSSTGFITRIIFYDIILVGESTDHKSPSDLNHYH